MRMLYYRVLLFLAPIAVYGAAPEYRLAAPIPGSGDNAVTTISEYAPYIFPFLLSVAAGSALVMFIYGAIKYMASGGNPSRTGDAKNIMTDAIIGLLIAVGSVLILRTINPALVELDLNLPRVAPGE